MFITIEGLDCSGKSTQAKLLVENLREFTRGVASPVPTVHFIREPGGTKISERIREILLDRDHPELDAATELLLFSASRSQLVKEVIAPALNRKEIVVCDRYCDSTVAYQGFGRGIDLRVIDGINSLATDGLMPHLTIFIDIPVQEIERRKSAIGAARDRMEGSGTGFYERVRMGYLEIARKEEKRVVVVNGTESPENVARAIWALVTPRLQRLFVGSTMVE